MLKLELAQVLTCEQYGTAIKTLTRKPHALPDGRYVEWFDDYEVHEFIKAWEHTHEPPKAPTCGQEEQLELPLEDTGGEAMRLHSRISPIDNPNLDGRTGSEDSGTQPGPGNTEEIRS